MRHQILKRLECHATGDEVTAWKGRKKGGEEGREKEGGRDGGEEGVEKR